MDNLATVKKNMLQAYISISNLNQSMKQLISSLSNTNVSNLMNISNLGISTINNMNLVVNDIDTMYKLNAKELRQCLRVSKSRRLRSSFVYMEITRMDRSRRPAVAAVLIK